MEEPIIDVLAETKTISVWQAEEPDGETTYHVELGMITLNLFREEWDELVELVTTAGAGEEVYNLELEIATLHFPHAQWIEFQELIKEAKEYVAER